MDTGRQVASGRAQLSATVAGTGAPVVFLHAGLCDSRMWDAQMESMGRGHRAIAYDRRGFGATVAEFQEHSAVTDLMAVLDATAGGAPAILVGCSQGGSIALDAALQHPTRVRALVLISASVNGAPVVPYPSHLNEVMAALDAARKSGDLDRVNALQARLFLDGALASEGRVKGPARNLLLDMNGRALRSPPVGPSVDREPAYSRLGDITVPTLALWGTLDLLHIQERGRHIASTVANGEGRVLGGVAHLPSLERPTEVTDHLMEFIERYSRRGRSLQ